MLSWMCDLGNNPWKYTQNRYQFISISDNQSPVVEDQAVIAHIRNGFSHKIIQFKFLLIQVQS